MHAALAWADRHGSGLRYTCIIHPDHAASLHVARKLGFAVLGRALHGDKPVILLERQRRSGDT